MNFNFIKTMHGWTSPEKAKAIFELTLKAKPKIAVEIGVFGGRGTVAIALALKQLGGGKVLAVDPWSAQASASAQVDQNSEEWWGKVDHDAVFKDFLWHIKKQDVADFIDVRRESSQVTALPEEIGLLIVDGNHNVEALMDAKRFAPLVALGGYCLLDDLDWVGGYVRQAEEYIKSIGFSFIKLFDGQTGLYQRVEIIDPGKPVEVVKPDRVIMAEKAQLTIAYFTSRQEPKFEWFMDSLINQLEPNEVVDVIIVDLLNDHREWRLNPAYFKLDNVRLTTTMPKPNIWQGAHRITKEDWWAMSNARNTAFVLCQTPWIACLDDRCVLMPGWLEAVKQAMAGNYAVCGAYTKRSGLVVERGFIRSYDKVLGEDPRLIMAPQGKKNCPGGWMFGCTFALPLEWALQVNGFEEGMDGLGMEDVIFGLMLKNAGYQINFDPQMRMIEDRTEGQTACGRDPNGVMKKTDKGISPKDKSHAALDRFGNSKQTQFTPNLRTMRDEREFKIPLQDGSYIDWYDGQDIKTL